MNRPIPSEILAGVLDYVEVSSVTTKRAFDDLNVCRQAEKQAADLAGPLLAHMVKIGAVTEERKAEGGEMLASHAGTLQLLKAAVDRIAQLQAVKLAADPGHAVDENIAVTGKAAGDYDSLSSPFVGRRTSEKKASDLALLKVLQS